MSLYSTSLIKADTFTYQPWSGNGILARIADHNGKRYIYADDGVPLPTSAVATYELVNTTLELILELIPIIIGIPERLKEFRVVYNTSTKKPLDIPKWANCPVGYTTQVPKEFDYWDGSLWITDKVLRNKTLKARKMAEINHDLEMALAQLRVEYPESEIMSWTKQEGEARRWLLNNSTQTPLIDRIVEMRGVNKVELINKIILKADQYAYAVGMAIGRRQYLEDRVLAVEVGKESELEQYHF